MAVGEAEINTTIDEQWGDMKTLEVADLQGQEVDHGLKVGQGVEVRVVGVVEVRIGVKMWGGRIMEERDTGINGSIQMRREGIGGALKDPMKEIVVIIPQELPIKGLNRCFRVK